jgi:hypothetical protein
VLEWARKVVVKIVLRLAISSVGCLEEEKDGDGLKQRHVLTVARREQTTRHLELKEESIRNGRSRWCATREDCKISLEAWKKRSVSTLH